MPRSIWKGKNCPKRARPSAGPSTHLRISSWPTMQWASLRRDSIARTRRGVTLRPRSVFAVSRRRTPRSAPETA